MVMLYIGAGIVISLVSIFGLVTIAVDAEAKKNVDRCHNEEKDSFLRCQAYLDRGDRK